MTAAQAAHAAAHAVRALNHYTLGPPDDRDPDGYRHPSDVDAVIGALELLADRLPQALQQAAAWLHARHAAGRVGHDQGDDVTAAVSELLADLADASRAADALGWALEAARRNSSHLTGVTR